MTKWSAQLHLRLFSVWMYLQPWPQTNDSWKCYFFFTCYLAELYELGFASIFRCLFRVQWIFMQISNTVYLQIPESLSHLSSAFRAYIEQPSTADTGPMRGASVVSGTRVLAADAWVLRVDRWASMDWTCSGIQLGSGLSQPSLAHPDVEDNDPCNKPSLSLNGLVGAHGNLSLWLMLQAFFLVSTFFLQPCAELWPPPLSAFLHFEMYATLHHLFKSSETSGGSFTSRLHLFWCAHCPAGVDHC